MCEGKGQNWEFKSQIIAKNIFCIACVMEGSLSDASIQSSLKKLFDKEMLQKLCIMIDRMKEKYEDRRESIKIQGQLISMKEEKQ